MKEKFINIQDSINTNFFDFSKEEKIALAVDIMRKMAISDDLRSLDVKFTEEYENIGLKKGDFNLNKIIYKLAGVVEDSIKH
jgi:hypothetical protein